MRTFPTPKNSAPYQTLTRIFEPKPSAKTFTHTSKHAHTLSYTTPTHMPKCEKTKRIVEARKGGRKSRGRISMQRRAHTHTYKFRSSMYGRRYIGLFRNNVIDMLSFSPGQPLIQTNWHHTRYTAFFKVHAFTLFFLPTECKSV